MTSGAAVASDIRFLSRSPAGTTFIAPLAHAPFPVGADARDHRGKPFWHGVDASGRRYRVPSERRRYAEAAAYSDARVLLHAPARFDPARPFHLILFLHGHGSEIERTLVREIDLPGQIDHSGANAVLVAPQLARDAADSAAGGFAEPGRAALFLDEAQSVLRRNLSGTADAWCNAPLIVAAYSGGYRAAGCILERGGLSARITGLVLLDALYDDAALFADWLARNRRAFLFALYSESSMAETNALMALLAERNIAFSTTDDGGPMTGIRLVRVETRHAEVPRKGPPAEPLGALLSRLTR